MISPTCNLLPVHKTQRNGYIEFHKSGEPNVKANSIRHALSELERRGLGNLSEIIKSVGGEAIYKSDNLLMFTQTDAFGTTVTGQNHKKSGFTSYGYSGNEVFTLLGNGMFEHNGQYLSKHIMQKKQRTLHQVIKFLEGLYSREFKDNYYPSIERS